MNIENKIQEYRKAMDHKVTDYRRKGFLALCASPLCQNERKRDTTYCESCQREIEELRAKHEKESISSALRVFAVLALAFLVIAALVGTIVFRVVG